MSHPEAVLDRLLIQPPTGRGIVLHTRLRREIRNEIAPEPEARQRRKYERLRARFPGWKHRKDACGGYNCFGHLFACRRTAVYEDEEVKKVLLDDGYVALPPEEPPRPGDVVLYTLEGSMLHVGLVMRTEKVHEAASSEVPFVLSKWDDSTGEDEHHVADVPFGECARQFFTDRKIAR